MKIKEIMIREVKTIAPDLNAREALGLLEKMQISGLPVTDKEGKLLGMFTEKSILKHILPSYVENVGNYVYEENPKAIRKKFAELGNLKVSQLMRKEVLTTTGEAALCEVAKDMLTQKARRVPVVDKSGKVIGMVARSDILKAIAWEVETPV